MSYLYPRVIKKYEKKVQKYYLILPHKFFTENCGDSVLPLPLLWPTHRDGELLEALFRQLVTWDQNDELVLQEDPVGVVLSTRWDAVRRRHTFTPATFLQPQSLKPKTRSVFYVEQIGRLHLFELELTKGALETAEILERRSLRYHDFGRRTSKKVIYDLALGVHRTVPA